MRSCITASLRRRKGGKQDRIGNETVFWGNVQDEGKHVRYCMLYALYVWEGIKDEEKV